MTPTLAFVINNRKDNFLQYTYENQRWNPVDGFCSALLPTDRAHFSTMDGREPRPKDSIKCPTMAWQWEGNWTVETNFEGKTLEKEVGDWKVTTVEMV